MKVLSQEQVGAYIDKSLPFYINNMLAIDILMPRIDREFKGNENDKTNNKKVREDDISVTVPILTASLLAASNLLHFLGLSIAAETLKLENAVCNENEISLQSLFQHLQQPITTNTNVRKYEAEFATILMYAKLYSDRQIGVHEIIHKYSSLQEARLGIFKIIHQYIPSLKLTNLWWYTKHGKSLKDKILDDIKLNGYLQEFHVGRILEEKNWYVSHNPFYIDPETKQVRESDIHAIEHIQLENERGISFRIEMFIEVKTSREKPWVFFGIPYRYLRENSQYDSWATLRNIKYTNWLANGLPRTDQQYKASNYYEAFKDYQADSGVFKAVKSISKMLSYHRHKIETEKSANEAREVIVSIALIVYFGKMFLGYEKDGEFHLDETSYITLDHVLEYHEDNSPFHIEVISPDHLSNYIDRIVQWAKEHLQKMYDHIKLNNV